MGHARREPTSVGGTTPPSADAYLVGLRLLARRELFTAQMREKLRRRGFPDNDAEGAIRRLHADGSLNDSRAAAAYATDAARLKLRGRHRTLRELVQRGLSPTEARHAVDQAYRDVDERTQVDRALARRLRGSIESPSEFRRLYHALRRQGFTDDVILSALGRHAAPSGNAAATADDP